MQNHQTNIIKLLKVLSPLPASPLSACLLKDVFKDGNAGAFIYSFYEIVHEWIMFVFHICGRVELSTWFTADSDLSTLS